MYRISETGLMGSSVDIHYLLNITFFQAACGGLVLCLHPAHFLSAGGDYITIGLLHSTVAICQKFTKDILALLGRGQKFELRVSLCLCFFYYFILVFFDTIPMLFVIRVLYALTTRVVYTVKQLIKRTQPEEDHVKLCNFVDLARTLGLAFGAILGAHLYSKYGDFSGNILIASCFILVCNLLLQNIGLDDSELPVEDSNLKDIIPNSIQKLKNLSSVDFQDKRNDFLIQAAYTTICTMYLSRVGQLFFFFDEALRSSSILVGYTVAYDSLVTLATRCFVPFIKARCTNHYSLLEHCVVTTGFLLVGLYYSPTYICSLIITTIVSLVYATGMSLMEDDVLRLESQELQETAATISSIAIIVVPVFAGTVRQLFGGIMLHVVTVMSLAVYVYIVSKIYLIKKRA